MTTPALIHGLALASKRYTIREIRDLFILAGAQPSWFHSEVDVPNAGQRETAFYGWINGIKRFAPDQFERIIHGVLTQVLEDPALEERLRASLRNFSRTQPSEPPGEVDFPKDIQRLLDRLIKGLRRAEFPLQHRRAGKPVLALDDEYDVQDLLHSQLRPWIRDIRPEEYTPSYGSSAVRIDFVLPEHSIAIEVKYVRNVQHAKKVIDELIIDIAHYAQHPDVNHLWIVLFDPSGHVMNPRGFRDLSGRHEQNGRQIQVSSHIIGGHHSPPVVNE